MIQSITIFSRFNGPARSGNGGYCCGRFASLLAGSAARVRLSCPPPLERPLTVTGDAAQLSVSDGDQLIAQVWPAGPLAPPPPSPGLDAARAAGERFTRFHDHAYPTCFVCGPGRAVGDGLRLFTGALDSSPDVAGVLQAPADLVADGYLPAELCWAALDCPGAYTFEPGPGQAMLLGEITAQLNQPAPVDGPLVVRGWHLHHQGRKHRVGTALYDSNGNCLANAEATWVLVPLPG